MKAKGELEDTVQLLSLAVGWGRLTCAVALIVEVGPYYAQLLFNRDVVYGEVVSNEFLSGFDLLTARQEHRLMDLGWHIPGVPCHSACERPHPNFHRLWTREASTDEIVRDVLVAVVTTFMRGESDRLTLASVQRMTPITTSQPTNH
jgi:hypothetical protein